MGSTYPDFAPILMLLGPIRVSNSHGSIPSRSLIIDFSWPVWHDWWTFSNIKLHSQATKQPKHLFKLPCIRAQIFPPKWSWPLPSPWTCTTPTNTHCRWPQRVSYRRNNPLSLPWPWMAISGLMGGLWPRTWSLAHWVSFGGLWVIRYLAQATG